nr:TraB/GumN family protein [Ramlibacter lithotrophicus]
MLARKVFCSLAAWACLAAGEGQAQSKAQAPEPLHIPVWEARKGLVRISLIGELHHNPLGVTKLPDGLIYRLRESDAIGFEVRPADVGRFTGIDRQGRLISRRIRPQLWQRIVVETGPKGQGGIALDLRKVDRLSPPWVGAHIEGVARQKYLGWRDSQRMQLAAGSPGWAGLIALEARTKPTLSLDTLAGLDRIWDQCDSEGRTEELLDLSLTAWSDQAFRSHMVEELPRAVARGQPDEVVSIMGKHRLSSLLLACTVTPRNQLWIERIRQHARLFFRPLYVVGAGHLGGSSGLLALLRKDGYIVRRVYTESVETRSSKPG